MDEDDLKAWKDAVADTALRAVLAGDQKTADAAIEYLEFLEERTTHPKDEES